MSAAVAGMVGMLSIKAISRIESLQDMDDCVPDIHLEPPRPSVLECGLYFLNSRIGCEYHSSTGRGVRKDLAT